ncbi:MAG: site-specific integrase [Acholeplasmataceae bacterium]
MSVFKKRNKYWIGFSYRSKRYRHPSPDNSRAGAIAFEALLKQRITRGEDLFPKVKAKTLTLKEFSEKWMESYVKVNNKPSEIKNKTTYLRSCLLPFFGSKRLNEISSLNIEEFKAVQLKRLKPKTINGQIGTLLKCLRTAVDWGELDKVPIFRPLRCDPEKFDYLNEEEANRLLGAASEPYKTAILLALHTGMRLGELMALNWTNVDFEKRQIIVKDNFSVGVLGSTKGNKIRYIPMTQGLYDRLMATTSKTGFVLKGPDGLRFRPECSRTSIHTICDKAKLRQIGWHKLRHTFASRLAEKGVNPIVIKELMGHSDIRTTMKYAHLGQHTLRDAIKTLETPIKIELWHHDGTTLNSDLQNIETIKREITR